METPSSWFPPESKESSVKFLPRVVATPRAVVAVVAALAATPGPLRPSARAPAPVPATGGAALGPEGLDPAAARLGHEAVQLDGRDAHAGRRLPVPHRRPRHCARARRQIARQPVPEG